MNLIIPISTLCFLSLVAGIPATGDRRVKDFVGADDMDEANLQADERLPKDLADAEAQKINRENQDSHITCLRENLECNPHSVPRCCDPAPHCVQGPRRLGTYRCSKDPEAPAPECIEEGEICSTGGTRCCTAAPLCKLGWYHNRESHTRARDHICQKNGDMEIPEVACIRKGEICNPQLAGRCCSDAPHCRVGRRAEGGGHARRWICQENADTEARNRRVKDFLGADEMDEANRQADERLLKDLAYAEAEKINRENQEAPTCIGEHESCKRFASPKCCDPARYCHPRGDVLDGYFICRRDEPHMENHQTDERLLKDFADVEAQKVNRENQDIPCIGENQPCDPYAPPPHMCCDAAPSCDQQPSLHVGESVFLCKKEEETEETECIQKGELCSPGTANRCCAAAPLCKKGWYRINATKAVRDICQENEDAEN